MLGNDSPVCRLSGPVEPDTQYRWRWLDNSFPGHYNQTETLGSTTSMNYTIDYPSSKVRNKTSCLSSSVLTMCVSVRLGNLRDDPHHI